MKFTILDCGKYVIDIDLEFEKYWMLLQMNHRFNRLARQWEVEYPGTDVFGPALWRSLVSRAVEAQKRYNSGDFYLDLTVHQLV